MRFLLFTWLDTRGAEKMQSRFSTGMWVSVYWGSLTIGRLVSGVVVGFVPVSLLLRLCFIAAALGAVLIWSNLTTLGSLLGLALMGVSLAPIFPSLIATTPARLGAVHTANGVGLQIAAAVLGQSFFVFGCTTPAYSRRADQVYCLSCLLSSCGFSRRMACQRFPIFQVPIAFSSIAFIALIVMSLHMSTCAASAWHGSFG